MKLSARLRFLIDQFRAEHEEWADPGGAKGCCSTASFRFYDLLVDRGFLHPPPVKDRRRLAEFVMGHVWEIVLDDEHDRYIAPRWYPNIPFEGHAVNFVEGMVIDWTARQYTFHAPYPLIFKPRSRGKSL